MPCTVVVGGFFGDEGKGKTVAYIAVKDKASICVRGGVGPNAGHTVQEDGKSYFLRLIPSGFIYQKARLLIGPGVAINPSVLREEMEKVNCGSRLGVDAQCAIIEQEHLDSEAKSDHLSKTVGSTKSGVGACNAARALRTVKLARDIPELARYVTNVTSEIHKSLSNEEMVLVEGSQGTFLSLYHGTYPYCTSKDTTASAACSDVGIGPTAVTDVIVAFKGFVTRVGGGPLEGELSTEEMKARGWLEYGTVTGRQRRAAPFNYSLARQAVRLNGATQAAVAKLDAVFPDAKGVREYNELPRNAKDFIRKVEDEIGVPVTLIGTGPDFKDMIDRREL